MLEGYTLLMILRKSLHDTSRNGVKLSEVSHTFLVFFSKFMGTKSDISTSARVLTNRGVAFVTYLNEANSQFAKEAMAHQALDHSEVLNVRWATVDPNPAAQKREALKVEDQAAEAIRRALPASFIAELEGRDLEAAKRRRVEGSFGLNGYEAPDDVWYAHETAALEQQANQEDSKELQEIEPPPAARDTNTSALQSDSNNIHNGGIISNSTLAALKDFKSSRHHSMANTKSETVHSLPLVGYGSDDDGA